MAAVVPPIGAMVLAARKHVANHLIDAGATSPDSAVTYQPGLRLRRKGLKYLTQRGIVTLTEDGRYWTDEAKAAEWRSKVRKRVLVAIGGALAATAAIFAATR